jgi:hypothetical protein
VDSTLTVTARHAVLDLQPHFGEFDAVVVAGDHHGIAIGTVISALLDKPLMIVCPEGHGCVVSHITCIGNVTPDMRFLYADDFFAFGASRARVLGYMNQSEHAPVVATYAAARREYKLVGPQMADLFQPEVSG